MSVYFVTARQVSLVKIGCADDPYDRLDKLNTCSPVELTIEAIMVGSFAEERGLHVRFAEHRVRGEWFTLTPEIELMIATFPAPLKGRATWAQRRAISKKFHKAREPRDPICSHDQKRYADAMAEMRAAEPLDLDLPRQREQRDQAA